MPTATERNHDGRDNRNRAKNLLPLGAIIGQVTVSEITRDSKSPWAEPGQWHYVLRNAKKFDTPVPYPGRLGLFHAPNPNADHLFKPHDGTTRRVCIKDEPCDVVITRPGKWGNPWEVIGVEAGWVLHGPAALGADIATSQVIEKKSLAVEHALLLYEAHIRNTPALMAALPSLKDKRLGCFCEAGQPCHGDVLVKLVKEVA